MNAGWSEVKVWATSRDDVQKIREFAEALRMKHIADKVRQIGRERKTPPELVNRALEAFGLQGSPDFTTPSGPTLTLVTDLARANQLPDLNAVVEMFAVAHPGNARFVVESVPAKVISSNIPYRLDIRSSARIMKWIDAHPDWAAELHMAVQNFDLDAWAEAAVREMMGYDLD
ncbi:hypothetical protein [Caballeronia sp. M23-90]